MSRIGKVLRQVQKPVVLDVPAEELIDVPCVPRERLVLIAESPQVATIPELDHIRGCKLCEVKVRRLIMGD